MFEPEHKCKTEDAVKWNPYNKVVQCHRCGHIYVPYDYEVKENGNE